MKRISILILLVTTVIFKSIAQITADSVFNAHYKASGGKELWDKVKTYTLKQSFVSNASSDYDMEVKASMTDGSMLKTKTIMKRGFIYGISPSDAFFKVPLGSRDKAITYETKDLSDKEKSNMKREVLDMFAPFYDYQAKGYIATYVGLKVMGAQKVHHVELAGNGVKYDLYFDSFTNLLTKQQEKIPSGEEITKEFNTYVTSDFGIKYPSVGTYYSSIDKRNVKLTTELVFNTTFDGNTFKR
jgi:hypothetical protein